MTTEKRLPPDAIAASTNLTGPVSNIQSDAYGTIRLGTTVDPRNFTSQTDSSNWLSQANGVGTIARDHYSTITHRYASMGYNCTDYDICTNTFTYDATNIAKFDAVVNFAYNNGKKCHATHLFWAAGENPGSWFSALSSVNALNACKKYIEDIFSRYAGMVQSYGVVNELFAPNSGNRVSNVYDTTIGTTWDVAVCEHARLVANSMGANKPKLVWTDYFLYITQGWASGDTIRSNTLAEIDLMDVNTLDAVGEQAHLGYLEYANGGFNLTAWDTFLAGLASRGLKLWLTELDCLDGGYTNSGTGALVQPTDNNLTTMLNDFLGHCTSTGLLDFINVWGSSTAASWSTSSLCGLFSDKPFGTALPPKPTFGGTWQCKPNTPTLANGGLVNGSPGPSGRVYAINDVSGSGTPPNLDGLGTPTWYKVFGIYGASGSNGSLWKNPYPRLRCDADYTHGMMFDDAQVITAVGTAIQSVVIDNSWLTATSATAVTDVRVTFPLPPGHPVGAQNFRAQLRKTAGAPTPTITMELLQNNTLRATLLSGTAITSTSGQVVQGNWDASNLSGTLDGSDVECRIVSVVGSGVNTVEIGAIEWNVQAQFLPAPAYNPRLSPANQMPSPTFSM